MYDAQKHPICAKFNELKMNLKMGETPKGLGVNYLKKTMHNLYVFTD